MPIDNDSIHCLVEVQQEGKGGLSTRVVLFSYIRAETPQLQSRRPKSSLPIIPFDLVAYA